MLALTRVVTCYFCQYLVLFYSALFVDSDRPLLPSYATGSFHFTFTRCSFFAGIELLFFNFVCVQKASIVLTSDSIQIAP